MIANTVASLFEVFAGSCEAPTVSADLEGSLRTLPGDVSQSLERGGVDDRAVARKCHNGRGGWRVARGLFARSKFGESFADEGTERSGKIG